MASQSPPGLHQHYPWGSALDGPRRTASERFGRPKRWPSWLLDAVRTREQTAVPEHLEALGAITLPDQDGNPVRLRDLWRDGPVVIAWLRQFGCPFCRAYAVRLNRARGRFAAAGARVVLIGQGSPDDATRFRRRLGLDLRVLTNADRVTYLWAGAKLATLDELIGPAVLARALAAMARERVILGRNTADEAQLGGSIVVMPDGTIPFTHISRDASDMATPDELLVALQQSGASKPASIVSPSAAPRARRAGVKAGAIAVVALLASVAGRPPAVAASESAVPFFVSIAGVGGFSSPSSVFFSGSTTIPLVLLLGVPLTASAAGPRFPQGDPGRPSFQEIAGAAPLSTDKTVAHWHGQYTDPLDGTTYGFNMVGADPALQRDVTIPVDLIPVEAAFPSQGNFVLSGNAIIPRLLASPIFSVADYSSTPWVSSVLDSDDRVSFVPGGPLSAANSGQFEDAIMRSQFNRVGTSYHVRLGRPTVLSPWNINCSRGTGGLFQNPRGVVYGFCDNFPFDPPWGQWKLDPTHLVLFVGDNLIIGSPQYGGALGYHTSSRAEGRGSGQTGGQGSQVVQTWGYATYLEPGTYNPAYYPLETDVTVFAHEIAEWGDDPFASNYGGRYYAPLPPQGGCGTLLEVGDPVDRVAFTLPGNTFDGGAYADGYWHMQDTVFLPWFAREAPNVTSQATQTSSVNGGRYSFMGDLNPYDAFHQPAASC
jgi:peroxiredoxin